jgi:DNA invertase Pin-like site-specific DNA recombinase
MIQKRVRAGLARAKDGGKRLGRPPIAPALEKRIREALATPGRPGVRVIAKQFGVDPGTVQRISPPFEDVGVVLKAEVVSSNLAGRANDFNWLQFNA